MGGSAPGGRDTRRPSRGGFRAGSSRRTRLPRPRPPTRAAPDRERPRRRRSDRPGRGAARGPPRARGSGRSLGEASKGTRELPVHQLLAALELVRLSLAAYRRDDDDPPVGRDLDLIVGIQVRGFEELLVEDERDAVPGARQVLDHCTYMVACSYV